MTHIKHVAFIGNSLPRRCGIATFTTDLQQAVSVVPGKMITSIVAMNDHGQVYDYPASVMVQVNDEKIEDYIRAAETLNRAKVDVVSLQHEFGIFGGEAGAYIVALLSRLNMPIVTTFHTVLAEPNVAQRRVMERIVNVSSKLVVMAEKGRDLLLAVYRVPADKIEVIPHGIPDFPFVVPAAAKARRGFAGRSVILTFGLLSPNKGIEVMIDAMPAVLKQRPDAVYVVLGATHPNLVRTQGEVYRESLVARARGLGVEGHVVFLDQFVDQPTLLDFISMCDVYVTPYLNEAQMTSGTLAYSFGLGRAVVSTPYWHARELLAAGRGALVPFGDSPAIGAEIADLLTDDVRREAMCERAYASSRSMTWERTAERYISTFESARRAHRLDVIARRANGAPTRVRPLLPNLQLSHFLSMCDDTGLYQHAVHAVPDRSHGYCVDDNARALLLACALNAPGEAPLQEVLTARFAAFVQHAWNPDVRRFRNFMSFDRRWLEDRGSEDSHGRTLWALGTCARLDDNASRRQWAADLFRAALGTVEGFSSPRAWAFTLLGLEAYCGAREDDADARRMRLLLADRLMALLRRVETKDWVWFEEGLSYDNARLPQALILTGVSSGTPDYVEAGLRSLRWLMTLQTTATGMFRPVGTEGFADVRSVPEAFDQQPVEATAAISACLAAWDADGDPAWRDDAEGAFSWFFGSNDLSTSLVDIETGSCRDGLHRDRANENRGGESVVSFALSVVEMRQLVQMRGEQTQAASFRALSA